MYLSTRANFRDELRVLTSSPSLCTQNELILLNLETCLLIPSLIIVKFNRKIFGLLQVMVIPHRTP